MKYKVSAILAVALAAVIFFSCIKKEAANSEADIEQCILDPGMLKSSPIITNNNVMVLLIPDRADITSLAPEFVLTKGATITPASGTVRDFTLPQTYTVTSEDGLWEKTYTVRMAESEIPTYYSFENWEDMGKYEIPVEILYAEDGFEAERQYIWSSGNAGYSLIASGDKKSFPTCSTMDKVDGQLAVKLETKKTGFPPMPLAAGNLFLGSFDSDNAMKAPLLATRFGVPFGKTPVKFKGHYKYKPGEKYTDKNGEVIPGKIDQPDIYAVFYEKGDDGELLHGGDILSDLDRRVAIARVERNNVIPSDNYIGFEVDFVYTKILDPAKLANYKYYLAIVFASSCNGDQFEGAAGSTLYIDEVEVICEED